VVGDVRPDPEELGSLLATKGLRLEGVRADRDTLEELFLRVDSYLHRLHAAGDSHRAVAISDDTRLEARLQQLMQAWRTTTGRVRRLSAFAEVPLFTDSKATRLLQLADFVAHWTYRYYEANDAAVFDQILGGFDSEGRTLHGLVHLYAGRSTCPCPACVTRRR